MSEATEAHRLVDADATVRFGAALAERLLDRYRGDATVWLRGALGAGKTTLVRGILQRLGHVGVVKSPTYTLLEPYRLDGLDVYHFDFYRVGDPRELEFVGFDEIIEGPGLKLIEWPEKATNWLPEPQVDVELAVIVETSAGRDIVMRKIDVTLR